MPKQILNEKQQNFVESALSAMSMEEMIGQLLCPCISKKHTLDEWADLMEKRHIGSCFISGTYNECRETTTLLQKRAKHPLLVASDMENGAVLITDKATHFPFSMGLGAWNNEDAAYRMGRITARESRSCGINWTFSPIADLNMNFRNPLVNIRSLGDDPHKTIPLLRAIIRGLQEDGLMAACAKHFPGDGVDDRDQHMMTSVNSLPVRDWFDTFGRVWQAAIDEGTMSIMVGHISFPDWQGFANDCDAAMPGTLCSKIQIDLLRNKLKFDGVIVSDAKPMAGITSRVPEEELAWRNIQSGGDIFLFGDPEGDYDHVLNAVRQGKLSEDRVIESARRILTMKAKLHLGEFASIPELTEEEFKANRRIAQDVADHSVSTFKKRQGIFPVSVSEKKKVLTVTLVDAETKRLEKELPHIDTLLKARGLEVDHLLNPSHIDLDKEMEKYDAIFMNIILMPHAGRCSIRLARSAWEFFWHCYFPGHPDRLIFTTFGSPYFLFETPALPNLTGVYGASEVCQEAAVKTWFGEIKADAGCPVHQPVKQVRRFIPEYNT